MGYELVVIDIAGTTVFDGDAVGTCLRRSLARVAREPFTRDEVNAYMGIAKHVAIDALLRQRRGREPDASLVRDVLGDFETAMRDYYRTSPEVYAIEGAADVFRSLRAAGTKVVLDTGFSRGIIDVVLQRLGWTSGVVDATVTSDEVAAGRPAPDMVYRAMELTAVTDVSRVVKVGDTPSDLHEGTSAGCGMVVGVTSGSHTAAELRGHPHTHLIESIRDLPEFLRAADTSGPPQNVVSIAPQGVRS